MFNWFAPKVFNQGYLPEKDGHQVWFMEVGDPKGRPVLFFHGGPGGAAGLYATRTFGRRGFRMILFDQRGCGRSLPVGETKNNTTADLVEDARRLLEFLDIRQKVILYGGSWGASLALLFAEKYPECVDALLLSKIFLADETAIAWVDEHSRWFYPDLMEKLCENIPEGTRLPEYYAELANGSDPAGHQRAVCLYGNYERQLGQLEPVVAEERDFTADDLNAVRIYAAYAAAGFMLEPDQIMRNIGKIKHLPALIVHNRLDMVCPLIGAWRLHKALPDSRLVIVPEKGHVGPLIGKTLRNEVRRFLKI